MVSSTVAAMSEMSAEPPARPGARPGGRGPFHIECRPATHTNRASNTPQRSGRSANETTPIRRRPRELGSEGVGVGLDNARGARKESARPPSDRRRPLAVLVYLLPARRMRPGVPPRGARRHRGLFTFRRRRASRLHPAQPRRRRGFERQRLAALGHIRLRRELIRAAAARYGIAEEAIAGAVLWDALENPYKRPFMRLGPGKVRPSRLGGPSAAELAERAASSRFRRRARSRAGGCCSDPTARSSTSPRSSRATPPTTGRSPGWRSATIPLCPARSTRAETALSVRGGSPIVASGTRERCRGPQTRWGPGWPSTSISFAPLCAPAPLSDGRRRSGGAGSLPQPGCRRQELEAATSVRAVRAYRLDEVRAYMGHADLAMTIRYVHHVPAQDAAERLSAVLAEVQPAFDARQLLRTRARRRKPLQMWAGVDASESGASLMARKQSSLPARSGQPAKGSHW